MTKAAKPKIRVLIVDDHAVVRSGLHLLLEAEADIEVVGEAGEVEGRRLRGAGQAAGRDPDGRRHARPERDRGRSARAQGGAEGEGARPLDAGRPALRARGVQRRRVRVRAEGGGRRRGRRRRPRGRAGRAVRPPGARRAARRRRGRGEGPRGGRSALGARARGDAPARARPHEPGDREDALHLGADRRDAPGAHHAEAAAVDPRRARALRASSRACSTRPEPRASAPATRARSARP